MVRSSSKQWLRRQSKDPYVVGALAQGYASRAAFKLEQIVAKHKFLRDALKNKAFVVDLGAAPGGWSQFLMKKYKGVRLLAVDRVEIALPATAIFLHADIAQDGLAEEIMAQFGGKAGLVLSDCSPDLMGHRATDQARSEQLAITAYELAENVLTAGGAFLVKLRQGGTKDIEQLVKPNFEKIFYEKPKASRTESAETYLLAKNFKGV